MTLGRQNLARYRHLILITFIGLMMAGCTAMLPERLDTGRHLEPPPESVETADIPEVVTQLPLMPEPEPEPAPMLFSVLAQDLPVRELLFTIARDAAINIDVHPDVSGLVSINAIDQTLPQILNRISRQVDMRWSIDGSNNLLVEQDRPYWHNYKVDYVNVTRNASTQAGVSNSLTTGDAGGGNSSISSITQTTAHSFWESLTANLNTMMADAPGSIVTAGGDGGEQNSSIIINRESGIVAILAGAEKHNEIESFLNFVQTRALQQVLIEATVVEVSLNDTYQSGVDWASLAQNGGDVSFQQNALGTNLTAAPNSILTIDGSDISGTLRMLSTFGDLQVLSSPKIMALNNQAAMLRVVDNKVYFSIEVEPAVVSNGVITPATFTSTSHTVPVGFVMNITPQIGEDDQVTLNVRPTISRIVQFVNDPNPALADAGVTNPVPEIQIREIESILKVYSGQIAVLGGLMQDSLEYGVDGVPTLSRLPGVGGLFGYQNEAAIKTELLVFIRPIVVRQPSLEGDLSEFREYLPSNGLGIRNVEEGFGFQ